VDQIIHILAKIAVADPVDELEDDKGDGENEAAVLVQIGRPHSKHLVQFIRF